MVLMDHPLLNRLPGRRAKLSTGAPTSPGVSQDPPAANAADGSNRAFVAALKIGGTLGGSRMQVMIDGILYAAGDVVDPSRGLMVMKIEDEARRVTFIDTAGQTYLRSF